VHHRQLDAGQIFQFQGGDMQRRADTGAAERQRSDCNFDATYATLFAA
jgi:hypothetical protein